MESEEVEQDETSQHSEINVIPVQFVESYQNLSQNSSLVRGKYYKQTYRPAWEQMPDFVGWLRGVEGEPTRAYCTYCQKTLHAHRLSLLKHTCTIRHQKAAQVHLNRKNKASNMEQGVILHHDNCLNNEDLEEGEETIEYTTEMEEVEQDTENDPDEDDEEEEQHILTESYKEPANLINQSPISTQVTDNTRGVPISGLQVSLYKLIDGRWTYVNEGLTNNYGKCTQFLDRSDFTPGRYKLHYDVDRYFESRKQKYLFPFIEVVFDSNALTDNLNIPILLGPFGYTTYKG